MAKRRKTMRQIKEVLRLAWGNGLKARAIARCCNVSRTSVSKYLDRAKGMGLTWPLAPELDDEKLEQLLFPRGPLPKGDRQMPDWKAMHHELKIHKHLTLQLLWEEYRSGQPDGFRYSQFCHHYRQWCKHLDLSMRQVHRAGEKVFVDFAGATVSIYDSPSGEVSFKAQIFVGVLGASNYGYVEALRSQALPEFLGAHVNMYAYFGGVPEIEVIDNLKAGVIRTCRYEPEINPAFHDMAMHYGIAVVPARPRKPKDKAKVEKGVQVVERWILMVLRHQRFTSLTQLNQAIGQLLIKLNERPFKKMDGSRKAWFERWDKPALKPLPEHPYEFAQWTKARVNIDYHIALDQHYYSVPCTLAQQEIDVRYTERTVEIFHRHKRVFSHVRSYRLYGATTVPEHMPKSHREYGEWTPDRMLRWADTIGPCTATVAKTIMESKPHPALGFRSCQGLLRLAKDYSNARLESACQRACHSGAKSYQHVKTMLKNKQDQAPLPEIAPTLAIEHFNVRGADYYNLN